MTFKKNFIQFILLLTLTRLLHSDEFQNTDESRYLNVFDKMTSESYSTPIPADIETKCKNQGLELNPKVLTTSSSIITSLDMQTFCGTTSICTIPSGLTVKVTSSLNLAALIVNGTLEWDGSTQTSHEQFIRAGYVAVKIF